MLNIHESSEDYLEAILMIREEKGNVHSIDIANLKGFSKASVSIAMKKLRENGYIAMDKNGLITLLPPGERIAEDTYKRHRTLTSLFKKIGVDPETAENDACRVEHDISELTFSRLVELEQSIPEK
ncbi:MAG: metal-dependent transcriptional regulator [Galactobacillus timonensis]|jgi:Mn-dependent DtxR family transcriptional regulator|uniref:metal-dependent transcriptional regulator n=1 Tax=Galactobacillus timonensis TaxID=2041840 RepID=UPI001AEC18AE|nr:metal-dependent transcriptional regulator [Galactobacillus timonensis]MDY5222152.1 metal-dependent transcriptional regulator [Lachnospiraceae bacterium]MDY6283387.1 metal-dependent transcriptional regulator [Erysipelotrichaceae bacterium]MCI6068153.1 metal-dependent transcriptional regulator [Galactobacillus timonensis]MCI6754479.1 metal-dependent transcriptional regulator [Galactobacillus timonensis]MDD5851556.1 metal-dependent transcriptional regulator [Galactobacillus timonensis]